MAWRQRFERANGKVWVGHCEGRKEAWKVRKEGRMKGRNGRKASEGMVKAEWHEGKEGRKEGRNEGSEVGEME
jgi:hypothetical protein